MQPATLRRPESEPMLRNPRLHKRTKRRLVQRNNAPFTGGNFCVANVELRLEEIDLTPTCAPKLCVSQTCIAKDQDSWIEGGLRAVAARVEKPIFFVASQSFTYMFPLWQHPNFIGDDVPELRTLRDSHVLVKLLLGRRASFLSRMISSTWFH